MNDHPTNQSVKQAACYACLLVCLAFAAVLPIIAVDFLSISGKLRYDSIYSGFPEDYSGYLLIAGVSALALLPACVLVIRSLRTGKQLASGLPALCLAALVCDFFLALFTVITDEELLFGSVSRILCLFALGLNLCSLFLIGSLKKDYAE